MSGNTGQIFTKFSQVCRTVKGLNNSQSHFVMVQGTLPWQPILDVKSAFLFVMLLFWN